MSTTQAVYNNQECCRPPLKRCTTIWSVVHHSSVYINQECCRPPFKLFTTIMIVVADHSSCVQQSGALRIYHSSCVQQSGVLRLPLKLCSAIRSVASTNQVVWLQLAHPKVQHTQSLRRRYVSIIFFQRIVHLLFYWIKDFCASLYSPLLIILVHLYVLRLPFIPKVIDLV